MIGVADGLSYLHLYDVIHGDLKGVSHTPYKSLNPLTLIYQMNILFDRTGIPQITDFGVSSITFNPQTNNASTPSDGYSVRWAAPEILEAPNTNLRRPTKMSDVYAFGIVVVEVRYNHHSPSPRF